MHFLGGRYSYVCCVCECAYVCAQQDTKSRSTLHAFEIPFFRSYEVCLMDCIESGCRRIYHYYSIVNCPSQGKSSYEISKKELWNLESIKISSDRFHFLCYMSNAEGPPQSFSNTSCLVTAAGFTSTQIFKHRNINST